MFSHCLDFSRRFQKKYSKNGEFGLREKANGSAFLLLLSAGLTQGCKDCSKRRFRVYILVF
jgi:hypothetical protein